MWFASVKPSSATVHWTVALNGSNLSALFLQNKKDTLLDVLFVLEVPARFELANNGFADRGLTTWLRYHMKLGTLRVPNLFHGAGDEARTRYLHLGKVALYRMSYTRISVPIGTVVPPVGIEPTTRGFSVRCSTY